MAQLKDKDGANLNPNTTAELVKYSSGVSVKQKIQSLEQGGAGVEFPNLFSIDDITVGKGIVYNTNGNINANANYNCVFIPLEKGQYYCMTGYNWIAGGGASGANNIALAKGTKANFSNLTSSDFANNAKWLNTDTAFTHGGSIYKQGVGAKVVFKTPSADDLANSTTAIGLVINTTFSGKTPTNDTLDVVAALYPIDYLGAIKGKNVAFFGDSITEGTAGGFVGLVEQKVGLNIGANYGSSGAQSNRLASIMLADPFRVAGTYAYKDYNEFQAVVIQIGTNGGVSGDIDDDIPDIGIYDISSYPYSYSAPSKTITSATLTEPKDFFKLCFANTFYGNVALCVEYVRYINPNCRIFLTTIPPSERGNHEAVRTALINLADKMSVQVIDAQAHAGLGLWNITQWTCDSNSPRTHLNAKGNEMWASYVAHDLQNEWYLTELD